MRLLIPIIGIGPGESGAEDYNRALVQGLASRGHRITVLVREGQNSSGMSGQVECLRYRRPPDLPVLWHANDLWNVLHIEREVRRLGPGRWDAVVSGLLPPLWAVRRRWPTLPAVYVPQSMIASRELLAYEKSLFSRSVGAAVYHWLQRWAWTTADLVVSSTSVGADLRARHFGRMPRRLLVSPLGVDTGRLRRRGDRGDPAAGPHTSPDCPIVVGVGRLTSLKDFAFLVRAFASPVVPSTMHLVIVGDGPQREPLKRLAAARHVDTRVHLVGFREDVERYLSLGSVHVLPSYLESFGLTILQAAACGVPSIARRARYPDVLTGCQDLIEENETGFLVDSEADLAHTLRRVATWDSTEQERLGRRAREQSLKFPWDRHVSDIHDALHTLVRQADAAAAPTSALPG